MGISMNNVYGFLALIFISSSVLAEDMTKPDFIAASSKGLTDALCTFDRFLECTEDSEKLCRAQMNMVVVPHCLKKYEESIPESMSEKEAQKFADRIKECISVSYPAFNQVDPDRFKACMTK